MIRNPYKWLAEDKEFCRILAEVLQIQADGGDDPAEFVSFAILEAKRKKSIQYHESRLLELEEQPHDTP